MLTCRPQRKALHAALQLVALILIIGALVAAFNSHTLKLPSPIPNLYSPHSWLGLLVVILVALQVGSACSLTQAVPSCAGDSSWKLLALTCMNVAVLAPQLLCAALSSHLLKHVDSAPLTRWRRIVLTWFWPAGASLHAFRAASCSTLLLHFYQSMSQLS